MSNTLATNSNSTHLKTLWALSLPAIIEQILATMVSYVDAAMVGALGANATAAVSISAACIWLVGSLLTGVGVGFSVLVSNAIGARDDHRAKAVIRQAALAVLVFGVGTLILFQALAGFIPRWLGAEAHVLPQAVGYLRYYTMAMPLTASLAIFSGVLRCMGNTRTPLLFNALANVTNVILNYFLIYDTRTVSFFGTSFTMPGAGMGVEGAAIASAIAIGVAGGGMLVAAFNQGERFSIHRGESFRPDRAIISGAARMGLPAAIERMTINMGQIAMTYVVASLGTVALAANQIANTTEGMCYLPAYGISYAATALVGQAVGAKNREDAQAYGSLASKLGFIICGVTAVVLFIFAPALTGLFNTDQRVVDLSALVLRVVCWSEPLLAVSVIHCGSLQAAHDVRFPVVMSLGCMWGVRVILTPLFVYVLEMGLAGVWLAMAFDLALRGVLCIWRWRSRRWVKKCGLA